MRSRSHSPVIRFCYSTVALGVLVSCERGPTAADVQPDHRRPSVIAPSSPSLAYTPIGTYSVGGVNASGSTTDRSTPGPTLPNKRLLYRVTATGTVTASRTAYWYNGPTTPGEGAYGPSGYAGSGPMGTTCYAFLYVGSTSTYGGEIWYAPSCLGGTPPLPNSASGHVYLAGATSINRFSSSGGGQWDCSAPALGYGPCFSWVDDGQTVSIERVEATLDLVATPTSVNYGDTVSVTASISPGGPLDGRDIPWTIDSTSWVPAFGTQMSPCSWADFVPQNLGATRSCRKPLKREGTLTLFATVNGTVQSRSVSIVVPRSRPQLTAVPANVRKDSSVTFTTSVSPNGPTWSISSWQYRPDSGAVNTGISQGGCGWNNNPCTRQISKSGTMVVFVSIDGVADSASARVNCLPCLTGDSILDDARVRRMLRHMLDASRPNDAASNRRERTFVRYRATDGSVRDTLLTNLPGATPCRAWDPSLWSPTSLGNVLLVAHSHPFMPSTRRSDGSWTSPTSELLPAGPAGCPALSGRGLFPGPSGAFDGNGDLNQPWPQIIADKRNVYWIRNPATDPANVMSVPWQTLPQSSCSVLTYY